MSLPDEFADALAGAEPVPDPAVILQASAVAVEERPVEMPLETSAATPLIPAPRGEATMGPEATNLPPLPHPDLPDLGAGTGFGDPRDLRLLSEVQVELAVELGRVKLPLRDLLSLAPGAVLELDRSADAPVDVLVNGCLVARGEVVVIDGEFGVRVTAVVER
jgi:flagellar motor switch protein FliN/FliY